MSIAPNDRPSVLPVAISQLPSPPATRPIFGLRWFVTSVLPVLSFVLAGAAAYASPPPRYTGPLAVPAITLPDVVVFDQPSLTLEANDLATVPANAEPSHEEQPPSIWVYDLPVAGRRGHSRAESPMTITPDQLPAVR